MVGKVNKNEGEEVNRGAGRGARGRARRARFWRCLRDFSELDLREVRYLETVGNRLLPKNATQSELVTLSTALIVPAPNIPRYP